MNKNIAKHNLFLQVLCKLEVLYLQQTISKKREQQPKSTTLYKENKTVFVSWKGEKRLFHRPFRYFHLNQLHRMDFSTLSPYILFKTHLNCSDLRPFEVYMFILDVLSVSYLVVVSFDLIG